MKSAHNIIGNDTASSAASDNVMFQLTLRSKPVFPKPLLCKYENVVEDYVVEGGVTLRAAGGVCFKKFVVSLTNEYEPPSIRTILRRIVKLYCILEPLLAAFLCSLDVAISLTLDGWSNCNLKGFYVVTMHWVDVASLTNKSTLLTILDISAGLVLASASGLPSSNTSNAWAGMLWRTYSTSLATMCQTRWLLSHDSSSSSIPSSATRKCARSTTSDASTTPSSSLCSRWWRSLRSPPSSYGIRWLESVTTKSCGSNIALKLRQPSLPARSRRTRTHPRAGTWLTRCVPTFLASTLFWTTSWTSMRPTLATVLSLTWNGMPSMACRRSFTRCARSWRASQSITNRRSTWCRCLFLCSWSTATIVSSNCRRLTASWPRLEWKRSLKSTKASWCRNQRSLWRT